MDVVLTIEYAYIMVCASTRCNHIYRSYIVSYEVMWVCLAIYGWSALVGLFWTLWMWFTVVVSLIICRVWYGLACKV